MRSPASIHAILPVSGTTCRPEIGWPGPVTHLAFAFGATADPIRPGTRTLTVDTETPARPRRGICKPKVRPQPKIALHCTRTMVAARSTSRPHKARTFLTYSVPGGASRAAESISLRALRVATPRACAPAVDAPLRRRGQVGQGGALRGRGAELPAVRLDPCRRD